MIHRIKELLRSLLPREEERISFTEVFEHFQSLLQDHQKAMEVIADLGEKSGGDFIFDRKYLSDAVQDLQNRMLRMAKGLNFISADRYPSLYSALDRVFMPIEAELRGRLSVSDTRYVIPLGEAPQDTPELLGGKAATLAEIRLRLDLPVPDGFVITSAAYRRFVKHNGLDERILKCLDAWVCGENDVRRTSAQIRYGILAGVVPQDVAREIRRHTANVTTNFAVRSSAYGEDGELSFAGLHESFLNTPQQEILETYKKVLAGLFSPEALSYRERMGMLGEEAAMAVLCQEMVPAHVSGVVHSLALGEEETDCAAIYATFGLGRIVVEGSASVDWFLVERTPPHAVRHAEVAKKEYQLRSTSRGR